ncbi:MAG: DUF742 domain-containing protein [Acidimicrobiales bacterium]
MSSLGDTDPGLIRPYVITDGRTRPRGRPLPSETRVVAAGAPGQRVPGTGRDTVVELCHEPHTISEVAAALNIPPAVATVVVSDLVSDGLLRIAPPVRSGPGVAAVASRGLVERLIEGIRAL